MGKFLIAGKGLGFEPTCPPNPAPVFFHGNGDQLGWGAAWLGPIFQQLGCAFYGVEYPGYGVVLALLWLPLARVVVFGDRESQRFTVWKKGVKAVCRFFDFGWARQSSQK